MRAALAMLLTAMAAGCGVLPSPTPYTYVDNREIEGKPGLFSGPAGQLTIYRQ